jgi:hypothetical protein
MSLSQIKDSTYKGLCPICKKEIKEVGKLISFKGFETEVCANHPVPEE